jgi:N-acyl homoserine lactone hydrolase
MCVGIVDVDVAKFMPEEVERGERYPGPAMAFLLRMEDGRNVLIDTGLAPEHLDDPEARVPGPDIRITMRPENLITAQLEAIGLAPGDVSDVIQTHFDFDHCGGNRFFPHATFHVQREQYEYAQANRGRCPSPDWDLPELSYELLDGDGELFPGVTVVKTSGHAPGHQSVIVRLPNTGTVIVASDAAQTHRMFEEELGGLNIDPEATRASIRKLKAIRDAENATVLVCHDLDAWRNQYRMAPDYYD